MHAWQSRYDFATKSKIFPLIKKKITQSNAKSFLSDFENDANYWRSIFDTDHLWSSQEKDIARTFDALNIFKVVQPTPGTLSIVRSYKQGKMSKAQCISILKAIENFHFQFNAVTSSRSSGGISSMYSSFGRQLSTASDRNTATRCNRELRQKLKDRKVADSEFDAGFG